MTDMQKMAQTIAFAPNKAVAQAKQNMMVYEAYGMALQEAVDIEERGHSGRILGFTLNTMWMHPAYTGASTVCLCGSPCKGQWVDVFEKGPEIPSDRAWLSSCCERRLFERRSR